MSIIDLNEIVRQGLPCEIGKTRVEYCDTKVRGLYCEVQARSPGRGIFRLRYKDLGITRHAVIGNTETHTVDVARCFTLGSTRFCW